MVSYEIHYFAAISRGDLPRMLLEVGGASYKNVFIELADWKAGIKETKPFGMVPQLVIVEADGTRKELCETSAIDAYLAEVLGLMPGPTCFERSEALSVLSAFYELQTKVSVALYDIPTIEGRNAAHEKYIAETIPTYLKYQERFVRGEYFFGDKLTVADMKLYEMHLWFEDMYGGKNPLRTRAAEFPKLNRIIDTLSSGKAGDYAKHRRDFGRYKWSVEQWKWIFN
ncbi:hypothetical protein EXIGLDRAFT_772573 [Exidia glandulosa HHB12029]|uniref:glutathione transferase n=1 Tax=Exidia glandulosa HHB12029 TaxID=1314781 RepID=A0A165F8Z5_EXIGL|nr:hypothetical protein EXIGLDRAFT_772573 [Exidia glandulosa HHB12029]